MEECLCSRVPYWNSVEEYVFVQELSEFHTGVVYRIRKTGPLKLIAVSLILTLSVWGKNHTVVSFIRNAD